MTPRRVAVYGLAVGVTAPLAVTAGVFTWGAAAWWLRGRKAAR